MTVMISPRVSFALTGPNTRESADAGRLSPRRKTSFFRSFTGKLVPSLKGISLLAIYRGIMRYLPYIRHNLQRKNGIISAKKCPDTVLVSGRMSSFVWFSQVPKRVLDKSPKGIPVFHKTDA